MCVHTHKFVRARTNRHAHFTCTLPTPWRILAKNHATKNVIKLKWAPGPRAQYGRTPWGSATVWSQINHGQWAIGGGARYNQLLQLFPLPGNYFHCRRDFSFLQSKHSFIWIVSERVTGGWLWELPRKHDTTTNQKYIIIFILHQHLHHQHTLSPPPPPSTPNHASCIAAI